MMMARTEENIARRQRERAEQEVMSQRSQDEVDGDVDVRRENICLFLNNISSFVFRILILIVVPIETFFITSLKST